MKRDFNEEKDKITREAKREAEKAVNEMIDNCRPLINEIKKEVPLFSMFRDMTPEQFSTVQEFIKFLDTAKDNAIDYGAKIRWYLHEIDNTYKDIIDLKAENEELKAGIDEIKQQNAALKEQNDRILKILTDRYSKVSKD
jgi:uncharacterized coiled-coil DUF342 family protein